MKPISMSTASAIPPLLPASSSRLDHRPGEHEVEEAVDRREARQVDRLAGAAGLDREQQRREDHDRREQLRAPERLLHRARARAPRSPEGRVRVTRASPALGLLARSEVMPGLLDEHVVERRLDQVERLDARGRPRRAPGRPARPLTAPPSSSTSTAAVLARQRLAEAAARPPRPRSGLPSISLISRCGWPICALSRPGVSSATIRPSSMIPTRLASWSASSRYCVVRKTVVPSPFRSSTSSQIVRRLTGSSPVVGSSRNSTRGSWTSADGEVEPPPHAARVGPHLAVGGVDEVDALQQRLAPSDGPPRRLSPCSVAWRRISSRPVISGSSAASCSATPIARRTLARRP